MEVLKEHAATLGITASAGDPEGKATRIATMEEVEEKGGVWKADVEAEWELLDGTGRMEEARQWHTTAMHKDMIYAVGGEGSPDTVEVYDTATNVWTELAGGVMSRARNDSASAVYKGKLYVVGGMNEDGEMLRTIEVYDFAAQQWSLLPTEMTDAREEHGVVVCEDNLFVVGGWGEDYTALDSVEVYDFATETWSILPAPMPQARASIRNAVVQHKGKIYVVGGYGVWGRLQSVAVYEIAADEWSVLPVGMRITREYPAVAVHGNKIYVLGGRDENFTTLRSVSICDIAAGAWSTMPVEMNVPRLSFAAAVHGDNLYAVGGLASDARHTMEVLALPSPLPWTPTRHATFPNSFKWTVYTLVCCFARTNALPDDVLFKIIWLLLRSAFKQPLSA
jgi:hypothetical protein